MEPFILLPPTVIRQGPEFLMYPADMAPDITDDLVRLPVPELTINPNQPGEELISRLIATPAYRALIIIATGRHSFTLPGLMAILGDVEGANSYQDVWGGQAIINDFRQAIEANYAPGRQPGWSIEKKMQIQMRARYKDQEYIKTISNGVTYVLESRGDYANGNVLAAAIALTTEFVQPLVEMGIYDPMALGGVYFEEFRQTNARVKLWQALAQLGESTADGKKVIPLRDLITAVGEGPDNFGFNFLYNLQKITITTKDGAIRPLIELIEGSSNKYVLSEKARVLAALLNDNLDDLLNGKAYIQSVKGGEMMPSNEIWEAIEELANQDTYSLEYGGYVLERKQIIAAVDNLLNQKGLQYPNPTKSSLSPLIQKAIEAGNMTSVKIDNKTFYIFPRRPIVYRGVVGEIIRDGELVPERQRLLDIYRQNMDGIVGMTRDDLAQLYLKYNKQEAKEGNSSSFIETYMTINTEEKLWAIKIGEEQASLFHHAYLAWQNVLKRYDILTGRIDTNGEGPSELATLFDDVQEEKLQPVAELRKSTLKFLLGRMKRKRKGED